jgi:hypothetical protein
MYAKTIEERMAAEHPGKYENPVLTSELVVFVIKMACHWFVRERRDEFDKNEFIGELTAWPVHIWDLMDKLSEDQIYLLNPHFAFEETVTFT